MSSLFPKKSKTPITRFTAEEDEKLLDHVSAYEFIWDMTHGDYKNTYKKDAVWQEIADTLNKTKAQCQSRWKSIRDHYKRPRKEDQGGTGPSAKKKRATYWDRLSFLDTVEEDERDTSSNNPSETIENDPLETQLDNCSSVEDISASSSRQELSDEENSAIEKYLKEIKYENILLNDCIKKLIQKPAEQDDIDLFFKSMCMTVKKFTPQFVTQTKMKVLEVVTNMELLQLGARAHNDSFNFKYQSYQQSPLCADDNSNPQFNKSLLSPSACKSEFYKSPSHHSSGLTSVASDDSELSNPSPQDLLGQTSSPT